MEDSSCSSSENDLYTTPGPIPSQLKRKGRFRIDLYAKRKKLFTDECLKEKIEATKEIKRLKAQISHTKRKASELKENIEVSQQPIKKAKKESVPLEQNSDHLNLSRVQEFRRRKDTMSVLKPVHCNSQSTSNQPVLDGMWSTLVNQSSTENLTCKIKNSQTCMKKVIPKIMTEAIKKYNNSNANFTRSIMLMYKGGILSKTKYKEMTMHKEEFVDGITIPRPIAYDRLKAYMNGLNMGTVNDLQEFASKVGMSEVYGVFRPLEGFLLQLAKMYLTLNEHNKLLHWFNGEKGKFKIGLGADGAPFGKDETATAFLVSFLNVLDGVQSCNNNYLLMGCNCDESHPLMYQYTKHVFSEMKEVEKKSFEIQGTKVTFECELVPSDQKWSAAMSGELNNAATYFSTYGNVCTENIKTIGGTLGEDSSCTWKPWDYEGRKKDVKAVEEFKRLKKIPLKTDSDNKITSNQRKKVTQFIASKKSRQEFLPYLDKYVDNVFPEPLHNTNNAWQQWNLDMLNTAMLLSQNKDLDKAQGNIDSLPQNTPLYKYVKCLKVTMAAGRLVKNIKKWFGERKNKGKEVFSYRFTGKESKSFCWYFMFLCKEMMNTPGIDNSKLCHVMSLAFSGLCLRNSIALYSRVHITDTELITLKQESELYFNCQVLLLGKTTPTTWTIGKAIPYYTSKLHKDLGFGLGLNSMQGREAKHSKLVNYCKNTTSGKKLRWWQIFKHEFMDIIWLRLAEPKLLTYRRGSVTGEEGPKPVIKEQYIPSCCNKDSHCYCGLPFHGDTKECEICSTDIFGIIKSTCLSGKIAPELKKQLNVKGVGESNSLEIGYFSPQGRGEQFLT